MKSVGYKAPGPIDRADSLFDFSQDKPVATGRDILVSVSAVSVNPVDTKMRNHSAPASGEHRVLGWDCAGTVVATGPDVTLFKTGAAVWYAGSIARPGTNSELHLVDERIVALKPETLGFAGAAAMPLTAITAWETLFDRLNIHKPVAGVANAILIIGGAGGVGSMAIQLAKALSGVTVIASASRPETQDWVKALGADHVVDHTRPLAPQIAALGIGQPAFVFSTTQTDSHFEDVVELIAPQGRFALIDDPKPIDVTKFKRKSVSLHWELMFTRSLFNTEDMIEQHRLLTEVAKLVDQGRIKSTVAENFGTINAENLKRAHKLIESGRAKGKIVLEGW